MNEQANLFSRGIEVPKKSSGTYVVRVLVVALLLAMIPMAPAWATHVTITLSPETDSNTVGDPHVVTATVTDTSASAPVTGTVVTFTASGTGAEEPSVATATTDDEGVATYTFTSTQTGTSNITATVTDTTSAPVTKEWTAGDPTSLELLPATDTNQVGENHTVTATVEDEFGNPVPGTDVTFTVTGTGAESDTEQVETTDANGVATFTFTSTAPGTSNITATAGGTAQDTATKEWTAGAPASLVLLPDSDTNPAGQQHTVTATVTDAFGNPVSGADVTFTASGTGAENPTQSVETTDANGVATFTFTSTLTGTSNITATAGGSAQDTATKEWIAGSGRHIDICDDDHDRFDGQGCSDSASNEVNDPHTVTATVHDEFGNIPPAGTVVTLTVIFTSDDTGDSTATAVTRTTNSEGQVSYTFNSTQSGDTVITATAIWDGELIESNTYVKSWEPGPLHHYHFDFVSPQFPEVCFSITITAHDVFHNQTNAPQTDINVISSDGSEDLDMFNSPNCTGMPRETFSINGERVISAIDHDTDGEVLTLRASSRPQEGSVVTDSQDLVILSETGGPPDTDPGPFEPGQPANVEITPESDTNVVGDNHTVVARVTDVSDTAVAGTSVTWTVGGTGGESPTGGSSTTDANGRATFTFTSSQVGRSTIFAQADGVQGSATKDWVCAAGVAPPTFNIDIGRDIVLASECGGYELDGFGAVHTFGDAPTALGGTTPYFPGFDIAREIVLVRDEGGNVSGGYILEGWGGLHPFAVSGGEVPPAIQGAPYFPGNDIARDVVLTGLNQSIGSYGGYLLDGRGAIHGFGGNSGLSGAPFFTFDIARELLFAPGEEATESGYILDGWGALHPFGGKGPVFGQPYFPGNDIANDALLTSSESGFILDGFGGIHHFGLNDPVAGTTHPYTLGNDFYPAFDLLGVNKGLLMNERGTLFDWFPGHVE